MGHTLSMTEEICWPWSINTSRYPDCMHITFPCEILQGGLLWFIAFHLLQRMEVFHTTLAEMTEDLTEAERERAKWLRVGDVVLDNLQKEIQMSNVSISLSWAPPCLEMHPSGLRCHVWSSITRHSIKTRCYPYELNVISWMTWPTSSMRWGLSCRTRTSADWKTLALGWRLLWSPWITGSSSSRKLSETLVPTHSTSLLVSDLFLLLHQLISYLCD